MRRFLVAALPVAVLCYFFLNEDEPIDVAVPSGNAPKLAVKSVIRPAGPPRTPISTPLGIPTLAALGSKTLPPSEPYGHPAPNPGDHIEPYSDPDRRIATLRRLADGNLAQLDQVVWQALEVEELDDLEFHEFILATLETLGDNAPGEILAALVRTAPTSELRLEALQLLTEASQELSVGPFNQALEDLDPTIRRSALDFFAELSANALLNAVADAAMDDDQEVRLGALSTLEEMNTFAPIWDVAVLFVDDPDPQIRMRALELLTYGDRQATINRLELALSDPNPEVSELAAALLTELEQGPS